MSTHTSLISAQMSGYHRAPVEFPDNLPDSFKVIRPRRLSEKKIASFDIPTSPSPCELYALQVELDHQSLQRVAGVDSEHDVGSEANSALAAALILSGPLNECRHSGRFEFQQIQFRALIASLALLHHSRVAALDQAPWERLKDDLAARFQPIPYQISSRTTLAEKMLYTPSIYLIQLASLYMSFIRRGEAVVPLIAGPLVKIFFASISIVGGQYNHAQQILQALNELLALRQKPQAKYRVLCGLQEYIRLVTSLARESTEEYIQVAERKQIRENAAVIVSTLLDKLYTLLEEEAREPSPGRPKIGRQWPNKVRAAIGRGPPDLDRGWFYYGLLDCVTQLSGLTDTNTLHHKGILDEMKNLILRGETPEYRWKAIETLLSCHDPCNDMYDILRKEMEERPGLNAREPGREARETLLQELKIVRGHLAKNQQRFRLSPPLTKLPSVESIQSEPAMHISRINTLDILAPSWVEQNLIGSRPLTPQVHQWSFSKHGLFKGKVSYHSAALSIDCKHAVLYNAAEVVVSRLEPLEGSNPSPFPSVHRKRFTDEKIFDILLARKSLIIITNKALLALDITRDENSSQFASISHGEFDYSGIACHEDGTDLVVMLGQRQGNSKDGYKSRIKIIKFKFDGNGKPYDTAIIPLSGHDCPKQLSYNTATKTLVCITRIRNRVLAWELDHDFLPLVEHPFAFVRNRYTEETRVTGITSASTFKGPSGTTYVACTTSPSSERYRNDGEWSFISPLSYPMGPHLRPPNLPCHDLEQFKEHRALTVGCVSRRHDVLAVLEDSGKISILSLKSHENGGICGEEGDAERLSEALCKQEKPSTSCLKFDPDGERLFAIDPRGKIIVTEFEKV